MIEGRIESGEGGKIYDFHNCTRHVVINGDKHKQFRLIFVNNFSEFFLLK